MSEQSQNVATFYSSVTHGHFEIQCHSTPAKQKMYTTVDILPMCQCVNAEMYTARQWRFVLMQKSLTGGADHPACLACGACENGQVK